jgi:hypothetical protein
LAFGHEWKGTLSADKAERRGKDISAGDDFRASETSEERRIENGTFETGAHPSITAADRKARP